MTASEEKIWYAVIQNKADGPHSKDEIQNMIDGGRLSFTDFIFKPGMASWTPISDVKEFERRDKGVVKTQLVDPIPEDQREGWVLLIKHLNENGKQTLIQQGPLTSEQVREKLARQEIKYDDHVWKKGFTQWKQIGTLDVFDRRRPTNFEKQPKPDFSQEKTIATGVEVNKTNEVIAEAPVKKSTSSKKFVVAAGAALLGMAVVYFGLQAYREAYLKTVPAGKKQAAAVAPTVKIQPHLKVTSIKSNTNQKPQIVFETNLPAGSKIQVEIVAELGDILSYPRLNMKKEITVTANQLPMLDLSKEDLPLGSYKIKASAQGLYSQSEIKMGYHDANLIKQIAEHKNQLYIQSAKEKATLLSAVTNLKDSEKKLQKAYSQFKRHKNQSGFNKNMIAWKKDFSSKASGFAWYEKQNPKMLVYPQAQHSLSLAKIKLIDLSREYSKKHGARSIASSASDDFKKALTNLQKDVRALK